MKNAKRIKKLTSLGYIHKTVCHKKEFMNKENGVNAQAIVTFKNILKYKIKRRKGC